MTENFREVLRLAAGKYFMWLSDDDWLGPSYISGESENWRLGRTQYWYADVRNISSAMRRCLKACESA